MYTEEIWAYVREEMRPIDQELERLIAYSERTEGLRKTAEDLKPILIGIERVIDSLQSLLDRCSARFPEAEEGGSLEPGLEYVRSQIRKWYTLWDLWNIPLA